MRSGYIVRALAASFDKRAAVNQAAQSGPPCSLQADRIHPNDRGHQYVAQLLVRFLQRALLQQQRQEADLDHPAPISTAAAAVAAAVEAASEGTFPAPMLPEAWPLVAETCLQNQAFQATVVDGSMVGFKWEDKGTPQQPEIRAVTDSSGSRLTFRVNTGMLLALLRFLN